jgi:hypothetical protein
LQERQLAKTALTIAAVAAALHRRGVEANLVTLAVVTGMAAFGHAARGWFEDWRARRLPADLRTSAPPPGHGEDTGRPASFASAIPLPAA